MAPGKSTIMVPVLRPVLQDLGLNSEDKTSNMKLGELAQYKISDVKEAELAQAEQYT